MYSLFSLLPTEFTVLVFCSFILCPGARGRTERVSFEEFTSISRRISFFVRVDNLGLTWLRAKKKIIKIIQKGSDSNQTHRVVVLRLKGQVFRFALADLGRVILIFDSLKRK